LITHNGLQGFRVYRLTMSLKVVPGSSGFGCSRTSSPVAFTMAHPNGSQMRCSHGALLRAPQNSGPCHADLSRW
jgi:hypothetical protein